MVVVGGGYTGLSAALALAERGCRTILVEARRIAWGASGRNAGHVLRGFSPDVGALIERFGRDRTRRLLDLADAGRQLLIDRIATHGIDCDLTWGYLHAALKPRHLDALAAEAERWTGLGHTGFELWDSGRAATTVGSRRYHGGLFDRFSGHLDPLAYAAGLARAAEAAGARIHEETVVTAIRPGPAVETNRGRITADAVLLCGNAYLGDLAPAPIAHRIMPVATSMIATAPLEEALFAACLAEPLAVADSNFVLDYFRPTRDRRIVFGGLADYSGRAPRDPVRALHPRLLRVFPQLDGQEITHGWSGLIAISRSRLPQLGRLPGGVWYAQGYSGQGVVLAGLLGSVMAEALSGPTARFDAIAAIPHAAFPLGPLRTPALVLAMLYYRLRDLL